MEVRQQASRAGRAVLNGGFPLLAPLPRLYRIVLFLVVLCLGIGSGVVLTSSLDLPAGGVLVGTAAGLAVAYLLVHDFHHAPRPARVPRRR
jgi:hypothetical protein